MDMALRKLTYNPIEDSYIKRANKVKYDQKFHKELLNEKRERKWMVRHGKEYMLDFNDAEIHKLKECFGQLDDDNGGCIGLAELENPLIGLGFADCREEVQEMIDMVDVDGSG